jgi:hypothetical protein
MGGILRWDRLMGFVVEQRWQGYVTEVGEKVFQAALYDPDTADIETVEFEKDEVNVLMRPFIKPGAILFFDIGYEVDPGGQKRRESVISLPMMPHVSSEKRLNAKAAAMKRFRELGWGEVADRTGGPSEASA